MIFRCKCYHSVLLVIVAVQMFICLLTFLITPPGWESSNLQAGEIGSIERIHVMLVMCVEHENGTMKEEEYKNNFLQVHSLLKTLAVFSSRPVTVHLAHNNNTIATRVEEAVNKFEKGDWLRIAGVSIEYPPGMEDMINSYKICATAKMFFPDLLPELDAGIYLDYDILMLGDPALLWDRFKLFSPFTALALAPVDASYRMKKGKQRIPFYGLPQAGLNSGVILMNLTRLRALSGAGFTGTVRYIWNEWGKENLPYPEMDMLNLVGEQAPYLLQPLPCEWHFTIWQCRFLPCPAARQHGFGLLHGADDVFYGRNNYFDVVLFTVAKFWFEQDVKNWDAASGLVDLEARLENAMEGKNANAPGECANVPGFNDMLLIRLRNIVKNSEMSLLSTVPSWGDWGFRV